MKRFLAIILCLCMALMLAACDSSAAGDTSESNDATPTEASSDATNAPAEEEPVDDTVYTLSFASTSATGSSRNLEVEEVLKEKLYEKSNGRLVMEIYPSGTLAGARDMLEALTSGIADIGMFLTPVFAGQFPYSDLYSTPGLCYGTIEETDAVIREYSDVYADEMFSTDLKLCLRWSIGTMAIFSVDEITTYDDVKGLTLRAASSALPFYESMGVGCVSMSASDVYEGLKMGTINATVTGYSGMKNNKLAEVISYAIPMSVQTGEEAMCMGWDTYNSLPADLQAVIDEVFAEMEDVVTAFTTADQMAAIEDAKSINPDFVVNEFAQEDTDMFAEAGAVLMEEKAAEMDANGLDGTGALEWLRAHAK